MLFNQPDAVRHGDEMDVSCVMSAVLYLFFLRRFIGNGKFVLYEKLGTASSIDVRTPPSPKSGQGGV